MFRKAEISILTGNDRRQRKKNGAREWKGRLVKRTPPPSYVYVGLLYYSAFCKIHSFLLDLRPFSKRRRG